MPSGCDSTRLRTCFGPAGAGQDRGAAAGPGTAPSRPEGRSPMRVLSRHNRHDAAPVPTYSETDLLSAGMLPRLIGLVAGGVATFIGLIAVARVTWSDHGIHAPAVTVASITFQPVVAIATLVIGLLALAAAAGGDRDGKLVLGVLLICVGLAIHFGGTTASRWQLGDRIAWLSGLVGAALVLSGVLTHSARVVRHASNDGYAT
jgi:hypothetical protein